MDTREKLKSAIVDWQGRELPPLQNRRYEANIDAPHVNDIVGVRRCGKTYYMYQLILELLEKGVPKSNILYLNLDDDRLQPLNGDELQLLIGTFREMQEISEEDHLYLFLDEVQTFPSWERWVKGIYDRKQNVKIVISGSNASLLSQDISTLLTGRHLSTKMFPFSFTEFLDYHSVDFDIKTLPYSEDKTVIKRKFNEYLEKGGFPEIIVYPSVRHRETLQSYFDDIIHRDIISRYGIRNPLIFKDLALFCISNIAKPHTYNSLKRLFANYSSLSTDAIINYIAYLEDAFLLFSVSHYDESLKQQINKPRKLYCIDTGMINAVSFKLSSDTGRLYENIVFIQLLRSGQEIYYWQDPKGLEVDFVTKQGLDPTQLIQVCSDLSDPETKEREVNGLLAGMKNFRMQEGTIITSDDFGEETVEGKKVKYVPLWWWLLERERIGKNR
ncbi:ATP-binding protein [Methanolobus psychrotolerans]|uniref:ATP-binding protein n=1 Tax=Methanolobus psychrotolerans TaxID=1874706 RepID=UPI0013EA9ABC|nr:ATP-binding protein [Methanolobus psychrotolerans]